MLQQSREISHQDRILERLNAEKQIAEDIAAIRLNALQDQASGLAQVGMHLRLMNDELALLAAKAGLPYRPPPTLSGPTPGNILQIPRQHGGPVSFGRSYIVGERGPETFVPSQNGTIVPAGGGPAITVNAPITISALTGTRIELQKVADSLAEAINEAIRRGTIRGNLRAA